MISAAKTSKDVQEPTLQGQGPLTMAPKTNAKKIQLLCSKYVQQGFQGTSQTTRVKINEELKDLMPAQWFETHVTNNPTSAVNRLKLVLKDALINAINDNEHKLKATDLVIGTPR